MGSTELLLRFAVLVQLVSIAVLWLLRREQRDALDALERAASALRAVPATTPARGQF